MMKFGAVRTVLLADGTVAGLVASRITSGSLPQKTTFPAITLLDADITPSVSLSGDDDLDNDLIQIDAYDKTLAGVKALAIAVRAAIDGESATFRGIMQTARYEYEHTPKTHRISMDFSIW